MRFLAFCILLAVAVCEPVAEAQWSNGNTELSPKEKRKQAKQEAKQARKEATQYYKDYIVKKRKALILIKKIEDERSRNASIRSFKKLYEEEEDCEEMGNGRTIGGGYGNGGGVSEKAKNKAMEDERKKYEKAIKKIDDQIDEENDRIEEAGLMTDELNEFIKKAKE